MATKYTLYTANGSETLLGVCRLNSLAAFDIIRINDSSISEVLLDHQSTGEPLPSGLVFRIPVSNTGLVDSNTETYEVHETFGSIKGVTFTSGESSGLRKLARKGSSSSLHTKRDFNCFFHVLLNGELCDSGVWELPVYPQEFSDNNAANFNSQSILGRSVDYQIYTGSSRTVNLTLNLHNELCSDYSYIHKLVAYFEAACYPGYEFGIVKVPEAVISIGSQFKIRGVMESCSAVWKAPVIDGKFVNCDVSLSIKETTGPYSSFQIRSFGGSRG